MTRIEIVGDKLSQLYALQRTMILSAGVFRMDPNVQQRYDNLLSEIKILHTEYLSLIERKDGLSVNMDTIGLRPKYKKN